MVRTSKRRMKFITYILVIEKSTKLEYESINLFFDINRKQSLSQQNKLFKNAYCRSMGSIAI